MPRGLQNAEGLKPTQLFPSLWLSNYNPVALHHQGPHQGVYNTLAPCEHKDSGKVLRNHIQGDVCFYGPTAPHKIQSLPLIPLLLRQRLHHLEEVA